MTGPKITLRIDRVTGATRGLDCASLERALHAELSRAVAENGGAFGQGGARARARAEAGHGSQTPATGIAAAVVKAVRT